MRVRPFLILAAAVCAGWAACVTITPKPPPEPERRLAGLEICAGIRRAGDVFEAVDPRPAFTIGTESLYAFVRIADIPGEVRLRWKWYAPDGRLIRDSGDVAANEQGQYLEVLTAFDRLDLEGPGTAPPAGTWQVVFLLDGSLAVRRTFLLRAGPEKK